MAEEPEGGLRFERQGDALPVSEEVRGMGGAVSADLGSVAGIPGLRIGWGANFWSTVKCSREKHFISFRVFFITVRISSANV